MNRLPLRFVIAAASSGIAGLSVVVIVSRSTQAEASAPPVTCTFTKIADTTGSFTGLSCNPTIDRGIVAFVATTTDGRAGIFVRTAGCARPAMQSRSSCT